MKTEQVDLKNKVIWIPDSKTPNGVAEVPLTDLAVEAFRAQIELAGDKSQYLFPSVDNDTGHQTTLKTAWRLTLRRAKVPYFRIYDLRSTYATRLSAGEWVTQLLRQGDAKVFKKYSQMKLQMKREALQKLDRAANESGDVGETGRVMNQGFWDSRSGSATVLGPFSPEEAKGATGPAVESAVNLRFFRVGA